MTVDWATTIATTTNTTTTTTSKTSTFHYRIRLWCKHSDSNRQWSHYRLSRASECRAAPVKILTRIPFKQCALLGFNLNRLVSRSPTSAFWGKTPSQSASSLCVLLTNGLVPLQLVPEKMRLEMVNERQIEIMNGGLILVNQNLDLNLYCEIQRNSNSIKISIRICTTRYRGIWVSRFRLVN